MNKFFFVCAKVVHKNKSLKVTLIFWPIENVKIIILSTVCKDKLVSYIINTAKIKLINKCGKLNEHTHLDKTTR